ncbi:MAG TPA: cyclophilin-like family protein [Anaerolineae bacterium]
MYFDIPIKAEQESEARAEVEVGELGYWPVGQAFCIFFGPTPVSTGDKPRAASPVNILGRVLGDATMFRRVAGGTSSRLEKA